MYILYKTINIFVITWKYTELICCVSLLQLYPPIPDTKTKTGAYILCEENASRN